jgi:transposase
MSRKSYKKPLTLIEGEGKRKNGPIMGIDVHRDVLAVCVATEAHILFEGEINNNKIGRQGIIALCRKYHVRSVAMEATSVYHIPITIQLLEGKVPFLVANPQQTKQVQGKKTDKLDTRRIVIAHRDGCLKPSVIPPRDLVHLRQNNRTLLRLIQDQTRIKQRLRQLFHFHDFNPKPWAKNFFKTDWTLNLFHAVLTTNDMISELVAHYYPRSRKKRTEADLTRIKTIITELEMFRTALSSVEKQVILTNVTQLRMLNLLLAQHRLTNYSFAKTHPQLRAQLQILLSVPSIGPDTAFCLLAEIVDINYFATPQNLVKWAGLAPRVNQSGHKKHVTGKIHKGGNKYVRRALSLVCTNIYARGDQRHPIYHFIKAKYQKSDKYWLSICAGARKLLCILWYLLTREDEWRSSVVKEPRVLKELQQLIQKKIRNYERMIDRYDQLQKRLTAKLDHQLGTLPILSTDPNRLLKDLLAVT